MEEFVTQANDVVGEIEINTRNTALNQNKKDRKVKISGKASFSSRKRKFLTEEEKNLEKNRRNSCNLCDYVARDAFQLKRHSLSKHLSGDNPCNLCEKSFATNDRLREHINAVHFKQFRHVCIRCNKGFHRPSRLKSHKCQEDFKATVSIQNETKVSEEEPECFNCSMKCEIKLPCTHTFCSDCINNLMTDNQFQCPQCKEICILYNKSPIKKKKEKEKSKNISTEPKCPVCTEAFKDPKFLECMHTFCADCIKRLSAENDDTVRCPICNQVHKLKVQDVDFLLVNFSICSKEESVKKKSKGIAYCHDCVSQKKAVKYCQDCCMNLCSGCTKYHESSIRFINHEIVSICDAPEKGMRTGSRYCPKHNELLKLFCEQCNTVVCQDCQISKQHNGHEFSLVLEVIERIKCNLTEKIKMAEDVGDILEPHLECGNTFLKEVEESDNNSIQLVEKIFDAAKEELNKTKDAIIQQIRDKSNTKSFFKFRESVKNLKELLNFIKTVKSQKEYDENIEVMLSLSSKLQESLDNIGSEGIMQNQETNVPELSYKHCSSDEQQISKPLLNYGGYIQADSNISDSKPFSMKKIDWTENRDAQNFFQHVFAANFEL